MQFRNYIFLFLLISITGRAQFLEDIKSSLKKKPSIDARLETRNSFITNYRAKISGVRLGLVFQKKIKVGIGYSWLNSAITERKAIINPFGLKDTVDNYLKFGYLALYTDFVFHKTKRWQLSVPLQWGAGLSWHQYNNGIYTIKTSNNFLLLYEPGISVQFKIFKWCGLGSDIAYRFAIERHVGLMSKLNSPTYAFKFLIWFDQLFYQTLPNHNLSKKYGPAEW